ncbi:MAG TPA: HD-GYP domain-containing protein [Nitrospiraceae bacterium]|nr:HD-GYP domain-containing protein [Nitrospiraceae bacterium]
MGTMRKTIPLDQLTIGMTVVGMDRSWLETPFLRHRVRITRRDQIDKLKKAGVRFVEVEGEECVEAVAVPPIGQVPDPVRTEEASELSHAPPDHRTTAFDEELPIAHEIYRSAKGVVESAMNDVRIGRAIDSEGVSRLVTGIVDSILRNSDALVSLSRLKSFDEYTFFHSVNTSVLSVALGRRLGLSPQTLHLLGSGTLLHDIGKTKIPLEILNKPGRFDPHEFEIMKQHALRGVEVLAATTGFQEEIIRPALEHHERVDGTGYPFGRRRAELTPFGLIASIVDVYDAMTSDRCYHKGMPAHRVLQHLYNLGQDGHLDSKFVQQFIQCVGVYPVGSCVLLDTGEAGIVSQLNEDQPVSPKLILVRDANLCTMSPKAIDLKEQATKPIRKIIAVVDSKELTIDVEMHLAAARSNA